MQNEPALFYLPLFGWSLSNHAMAAQKQGMNKGETMKYLLQAYRITIGYDSDYEWFVRNILDKIYG